MAEQANQKRSAHTEVEAQKASNRSAVTHFDSFATHRGRLTSVVCQGVDDRSTGGAFACSARATVTIDLTRLVRFTARFICRSHSTALEEAGGPPSTRGTRAHLYASLFDLSGLVEKLDRWKAMKLTTDEVLTQPDTASEAIAQALPGPFDVVLSACVLTQMQLAALNVLSSSHPLFDGVRQIIGLTHLRSLAKLTRVGGRAILATDSSRIRCILRSHGSRPEPISTSCPLVFRQIGVVETESEFPHVRAAPIGDGRGAIAERFQQLRQVDTLRRTSVSAMKLSRMPWVCGQVPVNIETRLGASVRKGHSSF